MKCLVGMLISMAVFLCPVTSFAYYVIHLKNGRQIVTSQYWKQDKKVFIHTESGVVEFKEDSIRTIDEKNASNELQRPAEEKLRPGNTATPSKNIKKDKDISLEEYKQQKEDLKGEIETVLDRYRAAISHQDRDQQERLRLELTGLSKQIYDINDTVKERNKGVLPEGWTQE